MAGVPAGPIALTPQEDTVNDIPQSVTAADIESEIAGEFYFTGEEAVLGAYKANNDVYQGSVPGPSTAPTMKLLTFCVLVLKNGIKVVGYSACVRAEIFDRDKGREYARKMAIEQVWPLLGFRLADQLLAAEPTKGDC